MTRAGAILLATLGLVWALTAGRHVVWVMQLTLDLSAPTATPMPRPLTLTALKNAEYQVEGINRSVRLVDGSYRDISFHGTYTSHLSAELTDEYDYGDLDGDGVADAAVIVKSNSGGSRVFHELAAVLNRRGEPLHVASVYLGDRVMVLSVSIQSGYIEVNMITQGPNDALCCPTMEVANWYELQKHRLVPPGTPWIVVFQRSEGSSGWRVSRS